MKVTDWYEPGQKPKRTGPYQSKDSSGETHFQNWNGKFFGVLARTPAGAIITAKYKSAFQDLPWRGIAK